MRIPLILSVLSVATSLVYATVDDITSGPPCVIVDCAPGYKLVGADANGCGGECIPCPSNCRNNRVASWDPNGNRGRRTCRHNCIPCLMLNCPPGTILAGADENGCGGACRPCPHECPLPNTPFFNPNGALGEGDCAHDCVPCTTIMCAPGYKLVDVDVNGCGGTCQPCPHDCKIWQIVEWGPNGQNGQGECKYDCIDLDLAPNEGCPDCDFGFKRVGKCGKNARCKPCSDSCGRNKDPVFLPEGRKGKGTCAHNCYRAPPPPCINISCRAGYRKIVGPNGCDTCVPCEHHCGDGTPIWIPFAAECEHNCLGTPCQGTQCHLGQTSNCNAECVDCPHTCNAPDIVTFIPEGHALYGVAQGFGPTCKFLCSGN